MTVRFTGIARRAIPPNRAKEWKPFVAGGVSQRISCAQNHRFRPRADAAVADRGVLGLACPESQTAAPGRRAVFAAGAGSGRESAQAGPFRR